eukprot:856960-Amphidinium_carterae.1
MVDLIQAQFMREQWTNNFSKNNWRIATPNTHVSNASCGCAKCRKKEASLLPSQLNPQTSTHTPAPDTKRGRPAIAKLFGVILEMSHGIVASIPTKMKSITMDVPARVQPPERPWAWTRS